MRERPKTTSIKSKKGHCDVGFVGFVGFSNLASYTVVHNKVQKPTFPTKPTNLWLSNGFSWLFTLTASASESRKLL